MINPANMDKTGTIQTGTGTTTRGRKDLTWANTYLNVRSQKLAPLRSAGSEKEEANQQVFVQKNSWLIRRENRTIVPKNMRYQVDGENHHIYNVRDYMNTRDWIVLDTEFRDNE